MVPIAYYTSFESHYNELPAVTSKYMWSDLRPRLYDYRGTQAHGVFK